MNLYNDIKKLEKIIKDLKKEYTWVKDKKTTLERHNTLIDVRNNYNNVLSHNFKIESLNTLILSNVLLRIRVDRNIKPNHADLELYFKEVIADIDYGYEQKLADLCGNILDGVEFRHLENGEPEKILKAGVKDKIKESIVNMLQTIKFEIKWI